MKFKESLLAHRLLDGLEGIEVGGSAHNAFGLKTRNVDFTDSLETEFKTGGNQTLRRSHAGRYRGSGR